MPFISSTDGDLKTAFVTNAWLIDQFVGNRLFTWGWNTSGTYGENTGQLGDNTIIHRSSPVQTIAGETNWRYVACGNYHTAAIKTDGTLWTWGWNYMGALGDNTRTNKSSPVQTIAGGTTWSKVSAGYLYTAAIKTDGTLWTFGSTGYGQLANNGTLTDKSSPIQTIAGGKNWRYVACGKYHAAAIKTDGTLWTWGNNFWGNLGDNTTIDKSSPIQTITFGTTWSSVSCGNSHTAAIKKDGTLWTWGANYNGSLGDNTIIGKSSPIQIGIQNNWKQVSVGYRNTAGIKTDGTLWNWGNNSYGQLGDNTITHRSSPVQTFGSANTWKQVACGVSNTAGIKTDGTLWTWGINTNGSLGDNTAVHRSSPIQTTKGGSNWKQVFCGNYHTAAITYGD